MKIFVIGQTSVHWGRKEFGNIGNYYVTEAFFRELHRVFPQCRIRTTIQMSNDFCEREQVESVDLNMYYNWSGNDVPNALKEYAIATVFKKTSKLVATTPFINEVLDSDLIIDHSGDMWGKNADLAGENRFLVGLFKNRTIQLLGKRNVMVGGSPGPFDFELLPLIKETLNGFNLITTRDSLSKGLLEDYGIDTYNVEEYACPSYLFNGYKKEEVSQLIKDSPLQQKELPVVGFNICGWNMPNAPFNRWPRSDEEYLYFAELIEFITSKLNLNVCLLSHSNGFIKDPEFKLTHGRDFPILQQLYDVVNRKAKNEKLFLMQGVYSPKQTKAIIGQFDMMISGRLHGAVAALSQQVPTIIVDYGHEPKAHKSLGFAKQLGMPDIVVDPANIEKMKATVSDVWENRIEVQNNLANMIPKIKTKAQEGYDVLRSIMA